MIVLAYVESQCTKFHTAGWLCWFFTSFYLESYTWPNAISQCIWQWTCVKCCANVGKVLQIPWQWLDKHSRKKAWAIHGCLNEMLGSEQTEKGETGEEQSQEHAHNFLFTKNSSWQAKQSILHTTVTFYGNCVKICSCITMHHLTLPFSPGNSWPRTTWLLAPTHPTRLTRPPSTFFCFFDWR
jgi:hypothetical protein